MPFFKSKAWPTTSYGYLPPVGVTAHGWLCLSENCGTQESEPVRRWPKQCSLCGSDTDPLFDQPWKHDAYGVELQWCIRNAVPGGGFFETQWEIWQFADALRREDRGGATRARASARQHAIKRMQQDSWFTPGDIFIGLVEHDLEAGDLDWAADDLLFWFGVSSTDDVENNATNNQNSRVVIWTTQRFLDAGGSAHARMDEIKAACLKVAEGAFQILTRDQQDTVKKLSRS